MTGTRRRQSLRPALRSGVPGRAAVQAPAAAAPPRRSTGTARRGIPNKTIFAWAGIVLIALLIILYFVFFGGKDGDVAPGTSGSVPSSTSQPAEQHAAGRILRGPGGNHPAGRVVYGAGQPQQRAAR